MVRLIKQQPDRFLTKFPTKFPTMHHQAMRSDRAPIIARSEISAGRGYGYAMTTIAAISDLHGQLVSDFPTADLAIIAGDLGPIDDHSLEFQAQWLAEEFAPWLASLPVRAIVGVAGNHDIIFAQAPDTIPDLGWHYLQDSGTEIDGLAIWGTPWVRRLGAQWVFQAPRRHDGQFLGQRYRAIPDDLDILISHGPPYYLRDEAPANWGRQGLTHYGSRALLRAISYHHPRLVVTGHIHESRGTAAFTARNGQTVLIANASTLDGNYRPYRQPPLLIDLPDDGGPAQLIDS
jgi:Icc-related predicted phosphoesterase